jgi:hypothetical protein
MITKNPQKSPKKYLCIFCDYYTNNKKDYIKHLQTIKHNDNKMITNDNKKSPKIPKTHECICGKNFIYTSGLSRHRKICKKEPDVDYLLEMVKQNQEFKDMMLEQNKERDELTKKLIQVVKEPKYVTNNTTTNNNKFNLNFFLNEQCKDALNITDFVSSLALKLTELEQVGQIGYVEGISKIFIRGLKELDVYKRPIHCSDLKREVMYIKDENNWEKDNEEKERMKKVINIIAHKNIQNIPIWTKKNPDSLDQSSGKNDEFLQIVNESMGGENEIERDEYMQKIIKNVAKEIIIDK